MSSLKEIATLAGVSHATVSKALSGKYSVHPETRERIIALANQLHYQPSGLGRALVSGRTQCVGIYFNHGRLPGGAFSALFEGANQLLQQSGYHAMLMTRGGGEDPVPAAMRSRMVDGVIVAHARDIEFERVAAEAGIPSVLLNAECVTDCDCIVAANGEGMAMAVEHLVGLDHQHIAFVNSPYPSAHISQELRATGYVRAMAEAGLPAYPGAELARPVTESLDRLFAAKTPPTALVCFNDTVAMAVIHALRERGLRVPEDVSVVGCDDEQEAVRYFSPPLTTLRMPFQAMGTQAVSLLLDRMRGDEREPQTQTLSMELVIRRSTARPSH